MFGDIPRNIWRQSPEYNIPPITRVSRIPFPRSCIPGFIHSPVNIAKILRTEFYRTPPEAAVWRCSSK